MVIGILGKSRHGKTTLLKKIAGEAERAIILDPTGKLGHLGVCCTSLRQFVMYWRSQLEGRWKIVLQPGRIAPKKTARAAILPYLLVILRVAEGGCKPFWIVADEVDTFGGPSSPDPAIRAAVDKGGNFGMSFAFTARRPACVDRTLTSQCSSLYLFKIDEGVDLEYIRTLESGQELARLLPGLRKFEAVRKSGDSIEKVDFGAGSAPDTSREPQGAPETAEQEGEGMTGRGPACTRGPVCTPDVGRAQGDPPVHKEDPTIVLSLGELAAAFGYADPQKFRRHVLEAKPPGIWSKRIGRNTWQVKGKDIPHGAAQG